MFLYNSWRYNKLVELVGGKMLVFDLAKSSLAVWKMVIYYILPRAYHDVKGHMLSINIMRPNYTCGRILVHVTIYRRLLIGRDGYLDQSEAYDISACQWQDEEQWLRVLSLETRKIEPMLENLWIAAPIHALHTNHRCWSNVVFM